MEGFKLRAEWRENWVKNWDETQANLKGMEDPPACDRIQMDPIVSETASVILSPGLHERPLTNPDRRAR